MSVVAALPEEFSVVVDLGMWKPTKISIEWTNVLYRCDRCIQYFEHINLCTKTNGWCVCVCLRRYVHTCTLHVSKLWYIYIYVYIYIMYIIYFVFWKLPMLPIPLLMAEILHQLIGSLSLYLQVFLHPRISQALIRISEPSPVYRYDEDFC